MADNIRIIKTADGSSTIYLQDIDETYHSTHGALAESQHVYINNGLARLMGKTQVNILEIGFGTGLNALLTLDHLPEQQHIKYYTLEPFPLDPKTIHAYYAQFSQKPKSLSLLDKLLEPPFHVLKPITPYFSFCLINKTLQSLEAGDVNNAKFDLVYYDAFGPSKQEEMWTIETICKATDLMVDQGLLCTYCAQGQFKRNLKTLGLSVENPEGAMGKRQMTVGRK